MPAKARGRELLDVREALARLLDRYPASRRRALDDDLRKVLQHAEAIVRATEPAGRGGDGEESPGEEAVRRAGTEARPSDIGDRTARWGQAAARLSDDSIAHINATRRPGVQSAGVGLTPGQKAALPRSDGRRFTHIGQESGQRRREGRNMIDLEDLG